MDMILDMGVEVHYNHRIDSLKELLDKEVMEVLVQIVVQQPVVVEAAVEVKLVLTQMVLAAVRVVVDVMVEEVE